MARSHQSSSDLLPPGVLAAMLSFIACSYSVNWFLVPQGRVCASAEFCQDTVQTYFFARFGSLAVRIFRSRGCYLLASMSDPPSTKNKNGKDC
jgi:hypothetical protein